MLDIAQCTDYVRISAVYTVQIMVYSVLCRYYCKNNGIYI